MENGLIKGDGERSLYETWEFGVPSSSSSYAVTEASCSPTSSEPSGIFSLRADLRNVGGQSFESFTYGGRGDVNCEEGKFLPSSSTLM